MGSQTAAEHKPEFEKRLAEAHRKALGFQLTRVAGLVLSAQRATEFAQQEIAFGSVPIDENGMSAGMKLHLLQPVRTLLSEWRTARNGFDIELQPKMPDIRAVFDAQREVEDAERDRANELAGIERKLEASPDYIKKRDYKAQSEILWKRYSNQHAGRAPTMFATTPYYKVLMLCIGVAEWFINYDTLLGFTGVPAIAAASTVLLAVLLAFAAHGHGELLKQWSHRFSESREPMQRARDWRLFGLSTVALVIVLGAAGAARYSAALQVLASQSQHSLIAASASNDANPIRDVVISMLANVAAWIIGIFIAYVAHDDDPEYMDATKQWNGAHKVWTASRAQYEQDIRHTEAKCTKIINERRIAAKTRSDSVENELAMLKQITSHEEALQTEVEQVMRSNIDIYRDALTRAALGASGKAQIIVMPANTPLTPFEYKAMPLPSAEAIHHLLAA